MPPEDQKDPLDPKSFLLKKKDASQAPATLAGASASPTPPAGPAAPKPAAPVAPTPAPTPIPPAPPVAPAPAPAPGINPKDILLPKKETGPSLDSAQRVSAAKLFEQEAKAHIEPVQTPIGEVTQPHAPPPPKPAEESMVKAVQTYGSDINRVVKSGEVSIASIAAAEAERRAHATTGEPVAPQDIAPTEAPSPMRPVLLTAGVILMLCAIGITTILVLRPGPVAVRSTTTQAPFVEVDGTVLLPVTSDDTRTTLMPKLESARENVNLSVGLVEWLYVTQATSTGQTPPPLPIGQLLTLMAPNVPADLLRALAPQYLLGVHSYDQNQAFLIMRVDSYQGAYAAMLAWEPTMVTDLAPLFSRTPPVHIAGQTGSFDSSSPELLNTGFVDQVVDNHDARVVLNHTGDILLMWTFLDRNTLVITTNEYTLNEVIRRANTASVVPLAQ